MLTLILCIFFSINNSGIPLSSPVCITIPFLKPVPVSMALSLEDFLKHTEKNNEALEEVRKKEKQERALEREKDIKLRAEERDAQLSAIKSLIETSVKDEVMVALRPIQEVNNKRFHNLETDMEQIKIILKSGQNQAPPK